MSDAGEDLMFMGDYAAGVRVGDFSSCRTATEADPCEVELVSKFTIGDGPAVGVEVSEGGLAPVPPNFPSPAPESIGFVPSSFWGAIEQDGLIYASDTVTGIWILELQELP